MRADCRFVILTAILWVVPAISTRALAQAPPTPHTPVRSELGISVAFTSSLLIPTSPVTIPFPGVGIGVGVNLGSRLMIDAGAGFIYLTAGAKFFFTTGDVAPYLVGRVGAAAATGTFVFGGIGLDVSRADGTYAFMEGGPMLAHSDLLMDEGMTSPAVYWRTIDFAATFGYGKRF
jgi:hypothetical protein